MQTNFSTALSGSAGALAGASLIAVRNVPASVPALSVPSHAEATTFVVLLAPTPRLHQREADREPSTSRRAATLEHGEGLASVWRLAKVELASSERFENAAWGALALGAAALVSYCLSAWHG